MQKIEEEVENSQDLELFDLKVRRGTIRASNSGVSGMLLKKEEIIEFLRHKNRMEYQENKKDLSSELASDVEKFLQRGGTIKQMPSGQMSGIDAGLEYGRRYIENDPYKKGREVLKRKREKELGRRKANREKGIGIPPIDI